MHLLCAAVTFVGCMGPAAAHRKEKGMAISGMAGVRKKPSVRHATSMNLPISCAALIKGIILGPTDAKQGLVLD